MAQYSRRDTTSITASGRVYLLPDTTVGVANAEIQFKGKSKGTISGADGSFSIKGYQQTDTTLLVTFAGYIPQEVRLGDITEGLSVRLVIEPEYQYLGIGRIRSDVSPYSIGTSGAATIRQHPANSFEGALQGRISGLQVTQSTGLTSAAVTTRLRGLVNVMGDAQPLFVLDGVPLVSGTNGDGGGGIGNNYGYNNSPLAEINAGDIDKIEVLKDGASQAMYGARGANGVILLTSKKGLAGKTRFNFNYNVGIIQPTNTVKLANGSQYRQAVDKAFANSFGAAPVDNGSARYLVGGDSIFGFNTGLANGTNTNWLDKSLQSGSIQNASLSISGGSKRVSFFTSVDYRNEKGILKGTNQDRLSVRFNAENKATEFLTLGLRTQLSLSFGNYAPSGTDTSAGFGMAQSAALPIFPTNLPNGVTDPYNLSNTYFNPYRGTNGDLTTNNDFFRNQRNVFRNVGVIYASFDFLKHFNFRSEAGLDYYNNNDRTFRSGMLRLRNTLLPRGTFALTPTAVGTDARQLTYNAQLNNYLSYNQTFDKTEVSALVGNQYTNSYSSYNLAASERMPNEYSGLTSAGAIGFGLPTGGATGFAYNAWFGKATAIHNNKYVLTVSGRAESSSRFGKDNLWSFYPSVAAAWVISREDFMVGTNSWLSALKLRTSYGLTGNSMFENDISVGYWRGGPSYVDPATFVPGRSQFRLSNGQLTSDKITHFTAGFDAALIADRVMISADFFVRQNTNALTAFPVAPSQGVINGYSYENKGKLSATGIEVTLTSQNVKTENFGWSTAFTLGYTTSRINDLSGLNTAQSPAYGDVRLIEGNNYGTYYLARWAGTASSDDAQGRWKAGDELLLDRNGNQFRPTSVSQIDSARVLIDGKQTTPTVYGGLNNTVTFMGFDLGVYFTYSLGQSLLDYGAHRQSYVTGNSNLRESALEEANLYYNGNGKADPLASRITDRFLTNASFIRLRNVTLGYNLSTTWCKSHGLQGGRVFVNAENLWTYAPQFKGWDPEVVGNLGAGQAGNVGFGTTYFDLPQARTYMLGLSVTF